MSDCSMSAMEPKQPRILCTGCMETAKAKDIEQRYECLAHVAREMWRYMDGVLNRNWAYSLPSDTDAFREQLEGCGVSVDD